MNLLMAGNNAVYTGIELCIYSLLTHNKGVNIYIMTMDIEVDDEFGNHLKHDSIGEWEQKKLRKIISYLDHTSNITFIDIKDLYDKYLAGNPNEGSPFTPYAGLRLLADVALPQLNHILYLDCDTAICGDIKTMYREYLKKNYEYCAYSCRDACNGIGEMVSGVLLLNLEKIRRTKFLERARKNVWKNKYKYYDQMALRDAGDPYPLPDTYSYMFPLENCDFKPVILHFTNQLSPKIYDRKYSREYFYRRYPMFKYVKDGVELLDRINI